MESLVDIEKIKFVTAGACNLKCEYCYLKHSDFDFVLDQQIVDALTDGTYINTIRTACTRFNMDTEKINTIEFLGAESLLHAELLIKFIDDLFVIFPKIKTISVLTNFTTDHKKTVRLIQELDKLTTNKRATFYMCVSIDGPDGILTQHGHNVSNQVYINQFKNFCDELNKCTFVHMDQVVVHISPTIDKDIFLSHFSYNKNIFDYLTWMNTFYGILDDYSRLDKNSTSYKLVRININAPQLAIPLTLSYNESLKLKNIYDNWNKENLNWLNNFKNAIQTNLAGLLTPYYAVGKPFQYPKTTTPCSSQFIILPSGLIVDCPIDVLADYNLQNSLNNEYTTVNKSLYNVNKNLSDDEFEEYLWANRFGIFDANGIMANLTSALISELALSGQVPYKYFIDDNLHTIALNSFIKDACPRDNSKMTSIPYLRYTGMIRYYLNCFLPTALEYEQGQPSILYNIEDITYNDNLLHCRNLYMVRLRWEI